jgi:hypothetical protein
MRKPTKGPKSVPSQVQLPGGIILKGLPFRITGYHPDGTPRLFELMPPDHEMGGEGACVLFANLFANEEWIRNPVPGKGASEKSTGSTPILVSDIGACPGCGLNLSASETDYAVMHELPICPDFDSREALEFITWVRQRREN